MAEERCEFETWSVTQLEQFQSFLNHLDDCKFQSLASKAPGLIDIIDKQTVLAMLEIDRQHFVEKNQQSANPYEPLSERLRDFPPLLAANQDKLRDAITDLSQLFAEGKSTDSDIAFAYFIATQHRKIAHRLHAEANLKQLLDGLMDECRWNLKIETLRRVAAQEMRIEPHRQAALIVQVQEYLEPDEHIEVEQVPLLARIFLAAVAAFDH